MWGIMANQQLVQKVQQTCSDFCVALTQDEVSIFVRYTRLLELEPDAVLADIGDVGDSFYMIIGGAIKLYQIRDVEEFEVGEISAGGLVGEMSFFDHQPRTLRLKAHSKGARLLEVSRLMYNRLRIEEPYISTNLLEFVIRSLDVLVRDLSAQNTSLRARLSFLEDDSQ